VLGEGQGYGIAVDRRGDAYITGVAGSDSTVFIMKVSPSE